MARPRIDIAAATLLVFFGFAPTGATAASVFLEDQTWTELRDAIASGKTTILLPIGGVEQSGPAMALGKHDVRVRALAEQVAAQLGNALVAPVVSYVPEGTINPPTGHMRFPGTITVSDATFKALLDSAARSFKLAGFKTIVLIGDHGGYQADETAVADALNKEWRQTPVRVFADRNYYNVTQTGYVARLLAHGATKAEIGTHAGLADTSLMLAIDPSLVRQDRLKAPPPLGTADGVYGGDPANSSTALGQLGVDLIVSTTVADIKAFVSGQPK